MSVGALCCVRMCVRVCIHSSAEALGLTCVQVHQRVFCVLCLLNRSVWMGIYTGKW